MNITQAPSKVETIHFLNKLKGQVFPLVTLSLERLTYIDEMAEKIYLNQSRRTKAEVYRNTYDGYWAQFSAYDFFLSRGDNVSEPTHWIYDFALFGNRVDNKVGRKTFSQTEPEKNYLSVHPDIEVIYLCDEIDEGKKQCKIIGAISSKSKLWNDSSFKGGGRYVWANNL